MAVIKKAGALYRVSTMKQIKKDEKDSIAVQQHEIKKYANENNLIIVKEYIEPGVSAYKLSSSQRDILQYALKDALEGLFEVLLVFKSDRLSRNSFEYPMMLWQLHQAGVRVIAVADQPGGKILTLEDQQDKLLRFIEGWQAESESKNTSIRVKRTMEEYARQGRWSGGRPPYGFKLNEKDKNGRPKNGLALAIDEEETDVLNIMFDLSDNKKWGSKKIAVYLNNLGYRTREGRLWSDTRVRDIMQNPIVAGLPAFNRTRQGKTTSSRVKIKNNYDLNNPEIIIPRDEKGNPKPIREYQIIPLEKWQRVTTRMASYKKNINARAKDSSSLLTGFLKCGYCGKGFISSKYTARKKGKNGKIYEYERKVYRCVTKARIGSEYCEGQSTYTQKKIDEIFINEIEVFLKEIDPGQLEDYLEIKHTSHISLELKKIKQIEKKLERNERTLAAWVARLDDYFGNPEESLYSEELLASKVKEYEEKVKIMQEKLAEAKKELAQYKLEKDKLKNFTCLAPRWWEIFKSSSVEEKKKMLSVIIDCVYLWKDKIEICYNMNLIEMAKLAKLDLKLPESGLQFKVMVNM